MPRTARHPDDTTNPDDPGRELEPIEDDTDELEVPEFQTQVVYGLVRTADTIGREKQQQVYLGRFGPPWDPDRILAKWGGGRYKVVFRVGTKRVADRTMTFPGRRLWDATGVPGIVLEDSRAVDPIPPVAAVAAAPAAAPALAHSPAETVPAAGYGVGERLTRLEILLEQFVRQQAAQPPAQRSTTGEILEVLKLARDVFKPAEPLSASTLTTFFREGLKASRDHEPENGVAGAIREYAPGVLRLAEKAIERRGAAELPGAPPVRALPPSPAKDPNMPPAWTQKLAEELKRAIAAKDDPTWTADWIERYCPANIVEQLRGPEVEVLNAFGPWVTMVPELGTEEGGEFIRAVLAALRGAEDDLPRVSGGENGA